MRAAAALITLAVWLAGPFGAAGTALVAQLAEPTPTIVCHCPHHTGQADPVIATPLPAASTHAHGAHEERRQSDVHAGHHSSKGTSTVNEMTAFADNEHAGHDHPGEAGAGEERPEATASRHAPHIPDGPFFAPCDDGHYANASATAAFPLPLPTSLQALEPDSIYALSPVTRLVARQPPPQSPPPRTA